VLDPGVSSFQVAADGSVYYLRGSELDGYGRFSGVLGSGVSSFQVAPDGSVYYLQNGTLYNYATGAVVDRLVYSFSVQPNGALTVDDWFSRNMSDSGLAAVARADFTRDDAIMYNDMLDMFNQAEATLTLSAAQVQSMQVLVANAGLLQIPSYVSDLANKVVNGDPANAHYQGAALGNLSAGSPAWQLQDLVNKWFLGTDLPIAADDNGTVYGYATASGSLFGAGGPSYQDIGQGVLGDCYFLAALGEVALDSPQSLRDMFIDNGNGTYTVRFYRQLGSTFLGLPIYQQVADYVSVNLMLPEDQYGRLIFAGGGAGGFQSISSTSNVLWVALAEKAYAQLAESGWSRPGQSANSYQSIIGGNGKDPLQQILGESTQEVGASSTTGLTSSNVNTLIADIQAGDMITIGTESPNNNTFFSGTNIVEDHVYYLNSYDATTGLFTLMNPWGYNLMRNNQAEGTLQLSANQLMSYFNEFDLAAPHIA
jgi:hypothetical protein